MTNARDAMQSITTAIEQSRRLPTSTTYTTYEIDEDGAQADLRPPIVEVTPASTARTEVNNTDFCGYATDDNGNQIGYIYRSTFEMSVQIDIWTVEGGRYDPYDMGSKLRSALYQYDDRQLGDPLPDPESPSQPYDAIDHFSLDGGETRNDLSMTPALRRWRQTAEVWYHDEINTAEEYGESDFISNVVYPGDGDFVGGTTIEIVFDASPNQDSDADNYT